jgi:HD-GYP domain-containing protein (c-di-GMP phosphodiesterase class II)
MSTRYHEITNKGYVAFDAGKLVVGTRLPFDVYLKDGTFFRILFNTGTAFSKITQEMLVVDGHDELYVAESEKGILDAYVEKSSPEGVSILDSPTAFKNYSFQKEQYYQIDKSLLVPGTDLPFCLYRIHNYHYSLLLHGSEKAPARVDASIMATPGELIIAKQDIPLYNRYLNAIMKHAEAQSGDTGQVRARLLKENSKIIMKELLENPRSGQAIKEVTVLVNSLLDAVLKNREAIYDLLSLRNYDYYTYTHSVNVAVLSVGLGVAVNLEQGDIEKLGIGAMLHDLGKSAIPPDILNKQGKLDDREFMIMQSHVFEGVKLLEGNRNVPGEAMPALLQHHEKLSGRGYPSKLPGKDIHTFGRIVGIADCYDALTTSRPYRQAMRPFDALALMAQETGNWDNDLLKVFIRTLGKLQ